IQILWINLITNGLPALALGVDPREPDHMLAPPRKSGGAILSLRDYAEIVLVGIVMAAPTLALFAYAMGDPHRAASTHELARARALVFAVLSIAPLIYSFSCRSERRLVLTLGLLTNPAL